MTTKLRITGAILMLAGSNTGCAKLTDGATHDAGCVEEHCVQAVIGSRPPLGDDARIEDHPEAGMETGAAEEASTATIAADAGTDELGAASLCSWQLTLQGGGRRLVPCTDECAFDLRLSDVSPESCGSLAATLSVQDVSSRYWTVNATLSKQAVERAAQISRALDASPLSSRDCPDCYERDHAWFTLPGSDQFSTEIPYPLGEPPANGQDADEFVQSLIDQLRACDGPLIRDCETTQPSEPPPSPPDDCTVTYSNADETYALRCSIPQSAETPCRAAAACVCGGGLFTNPADPSCVDWWLTPRGAPAFTDPCARGEASATRSLGQALRDFAGFYSLQVTASPLCDELRAFY